MEKLSLGDQRVINEEAKSEIMDSDEFHDFIMKSARICERALENSFEESCKSVFNKIFTIKFRRKETIIN